MFGRNKKKEEANNFSVGKSYSDNDDFEGIPDFVNQAFNSNQQNPAIPPQAQYQNYMQQVQPQQQPQPQPQPQQQQMQVPIPYPPQANVQQAPQIQQYQQYQQPVQQMPMRNISQFMPVAIIKQAENPEPGRYLYVVETNYPLSLGVCELKQ